MGIPSLLQGTFLTQESNQCLLHCRQILYQPSYQGSPKPQMRVSTTGILHHQSSGKHKPKPPAAATSHPLSRGQVTARIGKNVQKLAPRHSSVQFSHSVVSDSLRPHRLQHARPPVHHQLPEFRLTSIESVMPSSHLILCRALLLLPSIFSRIMVFSESVLHIR